jgi:hypothetical protein
MKNKKEKISEKELYKLMDAASNMFWFDEAEGLKNRLKKLLWAHRPNEMEYRKEWFTYVIRLVTTCPPLLESPPGFEWVMEDLRQILALRKLNPEIDRDFWCAIGKVRGKLRPSKPKRRDKDYYRAMRISHMVKNEGLSKTRAVENLAEEEARYARSKKVTDQIANKQREIWESLKKVKEEQLEYVKLLHR